ncbi:hypothetical protein PsorP6_011302 [Peronosclerospora sorghi]|uniref:Uncharacterized protein n=1 Tax=Peronosclerospora sorghi TaxID=230839 RepID=A0ACC0WK69_9STRA|nr:hypothetical protein PsorP6_011302 [Peronosclerospora sorghi]
MSSARMSSAVMMPWTRREIDNPVAVRIHALEDLHDAPLRLADGSKQQFVIQGHDELVTLWDEPSFSADRFRLPRGNSALV